MRHSHLNDMEIPETKHLAIERNILFGFLVKYIQRFGSLFGGDALCFKTFLFQYRLNKNVLKDCHLPIEVTIK